MTTDNPGLAGDFLKAHRLAVLATSKRDGSPQLTIIAYNFDGKELVINSSLTSIKTRNILKRPKVALTVTDGPRAVTVYGTARIRRGEEGDRLRAARLAPPRPATPPPGAAPSTATAQTAPAFERIIIQITPERIPSNLLDE